MKKVLGLLLAISIGGCASPTPYEAIQDTGGMGGYYHQRLGENTYKVIFAGNGFTEQRQAYDFALLRAAEICHQLRYKYFVIEGQDDKTTTHIANLGSTSYTTGQITSFGSYHATTNTYGRAWPISYPCTELAVQYYAERPSGTYLEVFEAKAILRSLSKKYELGIWN